MKIRTVMKKCLLLAAVLSVALFSCNREEILDSSISGVEPQNEGVQLVVRATLGDGNYTKTAIQSDGKSIFWTEGDAINLFYGDLSAGEFNSQITEPSATAEFFGTLYVAVGTTEGGGAATHFWGVYPYDQDNTCDGSSVTLTIPNEQSGVAGTFADKLNPTVATATGLDLAFYNVGSWFIFTVEQADIASVTLRGGNLETLVGTVKVAMDDNARPVVTEVLDSKTSITMTPASGGTFVPGEQYYMVLIPQTLANGYTLTLTKSDGSTAECVVSGVKEFVRSNYRRKLNADHGLTFNYLDLIQLVSPTLLYDSSTQLGWNGRGTVSLGEGYIPGTQCVHITNIPASNRYRLVDCRFSPVDVSSIANPALLFRFYINKPEKLCLDDMSQVELTSSGTFDEQEICWPGTSVFTNWSNSPLAYYELQAGWNTVVLPFENAQSMGVGSPFDPTKVSYFRFYTSPYGEETLEEVELAVDMLAVINIPAAATGVTLDTDELTLFPGEEMPLTATVTPAKATNKAVTWSSSDASVASVSAAGNVTAVAPGTATITATTVDGGYTADCTVTVYAAGIELVSPTLLYDSSTGLGWYARGTLALGEGYIPGTQCVHVTEHLSNNKYRIFECKFSPVDVSSIANPALLIRFYINKPEELYLDYQSQIELNSSGSVDEQEICWLGSEVFTNWSGHAASAPYELKAGWNTFVLPFADAHSMAGTSFNPTKVKWFRFYSNYNETDMYEKGVDIGVAMLCVIDLP